MVYLGDSGYRREDDDACSPRHQSVNLRTFAYNRVPLQPFLLLRP